jgi:hypothetical protein
MATNPTNSTTVSILDLPQAQLATSTDFIVLQTTNGTQIIPFQNFNVVKTDIYGNATVVGNLSGSNATFVGGINTVTLTASQYFTNGGQKGWTDSAPINLTGPNYYDSFTIVNGLVVSAVQTGTDYKGNPIYTTLNTQLTSLSSSTSSQLTAISATCYTQLTAMSSYLITQFQAATASYGTQLNTLTAYSTAILDATVTPIIQNGTSSIVVQFPNFFVNVPITLSNIVPSTFTIAPYASAGYQATAFYTAAPFILPSTISYYGANNSSLQVTVSTGGTVSLGSGLPLSIRAFVSYNAIR